MQTLCFACPYCAITEPAVNGACCRYAMTTQCLYADNALRLFGRKCGISVKNEKDNPAETSAGSVPVPDSCEYTVDDVNSALEECQKSLHEAVYIARKVWEADSDALNFDVDDLVQVESALQEICNLSSGIDCDDED